MALVGSWVIRIAVRAIVIAAWIIRGPIKDRNWDRYWQTETEEDPGLRLGLSQQCDRSLVSPEAFIVDSTFLASCEIGCHPRRDYDEK
jgi:hypothetical protein